MSSVRELAAESIGRITRRGLELQIAQVEDAVAPGEVVVAVAPGTSGTEGMFVAVTDRRILISGAAPFAKPSLVVIPGGELFAAVAEEHDGAWQLRLDAPDGSVSVGGMFDRDAQRLAALLT